MAVLISFISQTAFAIRRLDSAGISVKAAFMADVSFQIGSMVKNWVGLLNILPYREHLALSSHFQGDRQLWVEMKITRAQAFNQDCRRSAHRGRRD
jgi:hypothetical protein